MPRFTSILLTFVLLLANTARGDFVTLSLISQPGDLIGMGQTFDYTYTPANSYYFYVNASRPIGGTPSYISFTLGTVTGPTNTFAGLDFSTNKLGVPLQVGTYTNAERAPFASPGHPGLDVSFQNRGANTLTGEFTINSISFFSTPRNGVLLGSLDVSFRQLHTGSTAPLTGRLIYQNSEAVPEPSSLVMLGLGGLGVAGLARRRKA